MKKDYAGLKFKIMEEQGEIIDIILVKHDLSSHSQKIYLKSHAKYDGSSALAKIIDQVDSIKTKSLPTVKSEQKPNLFKRLALAIKHLKMQSPVSYDWKFIDSERKGAASGFAYSIFSKDQTEQLESYCENNNTNLNSLLLCSLDKASSTSLLSTNQERVWMIPVNIREKESATHFYGNHVTTLSLRIKDHSAQDIYQQVRSLMKSGIIWGGKIIANTPKYIGENNLRKLSKNIKSPYFGLCSNLGSWPLDGTPSDTQSHWVVASPVTRFCPVSAVINKWNQALSISILLHPSLSLDLKDTDNLIKDWVAQINEITGMEIKPQFTSMKWDKMQDNVVKQDS